MKGIKNNKPNDLPQVTFCCPISRKCLRLIGAERLSSVRTKLINRFENQFNMRWPPNGLMSPKWKLHLIFDTVPHRHRAAKHETWNN